MAWCSATYLRGRQRRRCQKATPQGPFSSECTFMIWICGRDHAVSVLRFVRQRKVAWCSATYLRGRQRRRCQSANSRAHSAQDAHVCSGYEVEITLYQSCDLADSTRWHGAAQRICEGGSDGAVKARTAGSIQLWMHLYVLDSRYSSRCISLARCQTAQGGILQRNKFARAAVTALSKGYPAGTIQHIMHFHDLDLR